MGIGQVLSSSLTPPWTLPLANITHTNGTVYAVESFGNGTNGTGVFPGPSMELMVNFVPEKLLIFSY